MKRDDETLLEYLIRIAKEKGEGLGEGLQQLGVDRLRKARPDAARRQGLMPDQLDIVEDDYMTQDAPDSLLSPQAMTQPVATPLVNRASIENQIAGNRGLLEPQYDETMVMESTSPITPRIPTVDATSKQQPADSLLTPRTPNLETEAQESEGLTGWPWNTAWFEGLSDVAGKVGAPMLKQAEMERIGTPALVEKVSDLVTETTPERETRLTQEKGDIAGNLREGYISGAITEETMEDSKLGFMERISRIVKGDPKPKTVDQNWTSGGGGTLDRLLGKTAPVKEKVVIKETPVSDSVSVEETRKQAKQNVGSGEQSTTAPSSPTYFGHGSKEEFLRAAGILGGDSKSKDFTDRMDKIDSESRMFDMLAMLGGAGNSRVGTNYRNKSYQRLKLEFDMDQKEWDRQFKIMAHPWVTYYWHDPNAGIPPKNVPQGMAVGAGWQRQPTAKDRGTTTNQNYDALIDLWDGSESSEDLIAMRYVNEFMPSGGFLTEEEKTARGFAFLDAAFPLPNNGKRWTPTEKKQLRHAVSSGNRAAVQEMLNDKNYIPESLKQLIEEFFNSGVDRSRASVGSRGISSRNLGVSQTG